MNYYLTRMVRVEVSKEEFDQHGRDCDYDEQRRRDYIAGVKFAWFVNGLATGMLVALLITLIARIPQ